MICRKAIPFLFKKGLSKARFAVLCGIFMAIQQGVAFSQVAEAYKWSVQYLIDNSQSVFGRSQMVCPRQNRGLALSPDGRFLYAGYNRSTTHPYSHKIYDDVGEVRKIDLSIPDYENATLRQLVGPRGKAIAVDDEGRVYLADDQTIDIYDAQLARNQFSIATNDCEGVAVAREGGKLVVYGSERHSGVLNRWVLEKTGKEITDATPAGLARDGQLTIPGVTSLRGLAVDPKGRIWMADNADNKVFRVDKNGSNLVSVDVKSPMAMAFDGEKCYVTQGSELQITIIDENMNVLGTLSVPWEELELSSKGNNHTGMLAGIAVAQGGRGVYVANEGGQTANQRSTYGRPDQYTDFVNGKLYIDTQNDDNEPILRAVPVVTTQ